LRKDRTGPTTKRGASTVNPKKEHHHCVAICLDNGMAMVLIANHLRQPLHNGLVDGADKEFYFIL
jgi:hypothetical protein